MHSGVYPGNLAVAPWYAPCGLSWTDYDARRRFSSYVERRGRVKFQSKGQGQKRGPPSSLEFFALQPRFFMLMFAQMPEFFCRFLRARAPRGGGLALACLAPLQPRKTHARDSSLRDFLSLIFLNTPPSLSRFVLCGVSLLSFLA